MRRFISDTLLSLAAAIWKQERPPAAAAHPSAAETPPSPALLLARCRTRTRSALTAPAREPLHLSQPCCPGPVRAQELR